jgi:hypothetical protein
VARYSRAGKRIVNRPARTTVPVGLLRQIDAGAAKVLQGQRDRDDMDGHARRLGHRAYEAMVAADAATEPTARLRLYEEAGRLEQQAGTARMALSRAERALGEDRTALGALHARARRWQRGEQEEEG